MQIDRKAQIDKAIPHFKPIYFDGVYAYRVGFLNKAGLEVSFFNCTFKLTDYNKYFYAEFMYWDIWSNNNFAGSRLIQKSTY